MAFMTGYQSMEGVPTTANRWLLKEVLKGEWGWRGILVTDWDNVGRMVWEQKICADMTEASALAIKSGNDLIMTTPGFFEGAQEAVAKGMVSEAEIDEVVARILALKFRLGLFENPGRSDENLQKTVIGCAAHREVNLEVARQSLVLLRNENVLPLPEKAHKLAVIGPNADDPNAQLGDWAGASGQVEWIMDGHPRQAITTILDGLRAHAPAGWQITQAKGCDITKLVSVESGKYADGQTCPQEIRIAQPDAAMIAEAVKVAEAADYVLVAVGDTLRLIGEYNCTATLELQGGQLALLEALAKTGKPLIIALVNSKPMALPATVRNAAAVIELFNPGMCGGQALAEAVFGHFNPSGRLTISFPEHVGQQPIHYSQVRGQHGDRYADLSQEPVYAFGEGLSYTTFAYSNFKAETPEICRDGKACFSVEIKNTGKLAGVEVAQLYVRDLVTSATWVDKELKAYARVELKPGESKSIRFELPASSLSIVNAMSERVVESGEFEALAGPNSRNKNLLSVCFKVK